MDRARCPLCHAPTRQGVHFGTGCGHRLTPPLAGDTLARRFHTRGGRRP
jgi:hypothetical protein